ncbi:MAG: glucose sorbosone dehydrogenase [Rariglobus sp.]|jgi:glucose/arabinose dehydrogenase|nr:glucose sorbosone dehydrogenase [Rariglobus sp.]
MPLARRPLLIFLCPLLLIPASSATQQPAREARKIYADYCAGCHGAGLEGGSSPALLGENWKHGGDEASLTASIRDGYLETGMPAFGASLSELEIRGLVVYIREQAGHATSRRVPPPHPDPDTVASSRLHSYRLETAFPGMREPWAIAFLSDDRVLITEKRGALRLIEKGVLRAEPVAGTPAVDSGGQAGLFDVVAHPDFARNGWIYLAFSHPQKNPGGKNVCLTSIVRGHIKDHAWTDEEIVFRAPVEFYRGTGGVHYGGRLAFDRAGYLFFSLGERGQGRDAQNLTVPHGKIHRIHDDGRIPDDNPFLKTPGAFPSIWTYGNRNAQGLRIDPVSGELWEHEHGPRGGDELNRIRRGLNYGWPLATFGMNYNGTPMTDVTTRPDIEPPATYWVPSIAPCGMGFYTGDRFPKWKNHLFVTSLAAQELVRLELKDGKVVDQEIIFKGIGRQRDVAAGPDGFLYVLLQDRVVRLVPAD